MVGKSEMFGRFELRTLKAGLHARRTHKRKHKPRVDRVDASTSARKRDARLCLCLRRMCKPALKVFERREGILLARVKSTRNLIVLVFFEIFQEEECHDRDGWCIPGTHDKIRDILVERTIAVMERLKATAPAVGEITASGQSMEGVWGAEEGLPNFLELLENDDNVEGYDIFGDGDDESETAASVFGGGAEGFDDESEATV